MFGGMIMMRPTKSLWTEDQALWLWKQLHMLEECANMLMCTSAASDRRQLLLGRLLMRATPAAELEGPGTDDAGADAPRLPSSVSQLIMI